MDSILSSYNLFNENEVYDFKFLENLSKLELFEIFKEINDQNIINFLKLIQKKYKQDHPCMYKDECIICYEEKPGILTMCNHFVCFDCYYKLVCVYENLNCPMCRKNIDTNLFDSILYKMYSEDKNLNDSLENDDTNFEIEIINEETNYQYDEYHIDDIDEWANNIEIDYYLSGH